MESATLQVQTYTAGVHKQNEGGEVTLDIKTYPEMNKTIKDLLRLSNEPMKQYILARIEELERQVEDLTPPPNAPLTLEEIRRMRGKSVWCPEVESYGIITMDKIGAFANKPFLQFFWLQNEDADVGVNCSYNIEERGLTLYRRKPDEVES